MTSHSPLLGTGPGVLLLLLAGVTGLVAFTNCAPAFRQTRPLLFLGGWWIGVCTAISARSAVLSLSQYGRPGRQVWDAFSSKLGLEGLRTVAVLVAFGGSMSLLLGLRQRGRVRLG